MLEIYSGYVTSVESISELIGNAKKAWDMMETDVQKAQVKALFIEREKELGGTGRQLQSVFSTISKDEKAKHAKAVNDQIRKVLNQTDYPWLTFDSKGLPEASVSNINSIMAYDTGYASEVLDGTLRYNLLGNYAEIQHTNLITGEITTRKWSDADEATSKRYIEEWYGIYSKPKHDDAMRIFFRDNAYNPVMDILNQLKWDGEERCEHFLTKWAKADDTPYVHECSRLIFAGGIWRMMMPGCKMDDVIILIGKQGGGKSSLVRFLAINDNYFGEIKSVEGKESIEQLDGKWICEIPELAAFTRAKEVEAIKAFITRQKDNYRKPFDRNVDDRPRRCIFIGTTNLPTPLMDATGGRRFYPVQTYCDGYDLFKHEAECRQYIEQCWAEALAKYKAGKMPNYAREDLVSEYRAAQEAATQDDWRIGAIEAYLAGKSVGDFVCVKELVAKVLSADPEHPTNPTPKDSKDVGVILSKMDGWEKSENREYTAAYGRQRGWKKVARMACEAEYDAKHEELPY